MTIQDLIKYKIIITDDGVHDYYEFQSNKYSYILIDAPLTDLYDSGVQLLHNPKDKWLDFKYNLLKNYFTKP